MNKTAKDFIRDQSEYAEMLLDEAKGKRCNYIVLNLNPIYSPKLPEFIKDDSELWGKYPCFKPGATRTERQEAPLLINVQEALTPGFMKTSIEYGKLILKSTIFKGLEGLVQKLKAA